jgi:multimeric flavodoxin WrbA
VRIKVTKKRVLILYYSFSSQTRNLLQAFVDGLEFHGVEICWQQLKPLQKLQFPLGSITSTLTMMVQTSLRKRFKIEAIDKVCYSDWDLVILAGPTWSYNPSGPVLSLIDHCGDLFNGRKVMPFISCRGYWRLHLWGLNSMLRKKGAMVLNPLIFLHVGAEPWLTIGVFLKLAG